MNEERDRGSRGCGLIGCLLLVGVLIGVAAAAFALTEALDPIYDRFLRAPHEVVEEYLAAHERDDDARARHFLCEGIRNGPLLDPRAPLGGRQTGFGGEIDPAPYPRPGGQIAIYYSLNARGGDAQALLEREDDGWRICAFEPG